MKKRKYVKSGKYSKKVVPLVAVPRLDPSTLKYGERVYVRGLPHFATKEFPGTVMNHQINPFPTVDQTTISYIVLLDKTMETALGRYGAVIMPSSFVRPLEERA